MEEDKIQIQINELNAKMDILLEYVQRQNSRTETIDDLVSDVSIIGKDIYQSSVELLDDNNIEINPDEIRIFFLKLLRNINNFSSMIDTLESVSDLMKDAAPLANELLIDFTKKLYEFESKGYFEFIASIGKILDTVITNYSKEDLQKLSENIPLILDIVKNISNKNMLNFVNKSLTEFNNLDAEKLEKFSWWKISKEMRTPQVKQSLGMMLTLIKNISDNKH